MAIGGLKLWQWVVVVAFAVLSGVSSTSAGSAVGAFIGSMVILWAAAYWMRRGVTRFKQTLLADASAP